MTRLDMAQEALKQNDMRMTSTRHSVLQFLADQKTYVTIDDIAEGAGERKMDSVTVYRILQALEDLSLVYKLLSVTAYIPIQHERDQMGVYLIDTETKQVEWRGVPQDILPEGFVPSSYHQEILGMGIAGTRHDESPLESSAEEKKEDLLPQETIEVTDEHQDFPQEEVLQGSRSEKIDELGQKRRSMIRKLRDF